jgi:hypothetical protein
MAVAGLQVFANATVGPVLKKMLTQYGLADLIPWASLQLIAGASEDEIALSLYDQPSFKARFPAIHARQKGGYPPLSVDEYLSYENTLNQVAKSYGVTLSKERVDALLARNVSVNEADERLGMVAQVVYRSDSTTRDRLSALYGIGVGDQISYFLNPREELPKLQRRFVSADIAASATRAGYNQALTSGQAEFLYERGMTGEAATEAFGVLVKNEELFEAVDDTESDIGVDDQLRAISGDTDLTQEVERRAAKRRSPFEAGGGFATGDRGIAGLGSAST